MAYFASKTIFQNNMLGVCMPLFTFECPSCKKSFSAKVKNRTFCSRKCQGEFLRRGRRRLNCLCCGKEFEVKEYRQDAKFCSLSCRAKVQVPQVNLDRKDWWLKHSQEELDEMLFSRIKERVKIDSGCWVWQMGTDKDGYGMITFTMKSLRAHREVYRIVHGAIPKGMLVCHTCDNPSCCNPDHLYLGSPADNSGDMVKRKRNWKTVGENCHTSKLTEKDVVEIRRLFDLGVSCARIARDYGLSKSSVWSIKKRKSWKHI